MVNMMVVVAIQIRTFTTRRTGGYNEVYESRFQLMERLFGCFETVETKKESKSEKI